MQIKKFNEMGNSDLIESVTIIARHGGYSMLVRTADGDEQLRTQKGEVRQFANWEVIRQKIRKAGIMNYQVIDRA